MLKKVMAGLVGLALVGGAAWAQTADPIKDRKANRQEMRASMGAIKKVIDEKGKPGDATAAAMKLIDNEKKFRTMFPAGSDQGDTKAGPNIWTDWAGFEKASKDLEAAAAKLVDATKGNDIAAVQAAFADTGKTCGACHSVYQKK